MDPEGLITLLAYNAKGELEYSVIDSNRNFTIDLAGPDRITRTVSDIIQLSGLWNDAVVRRTCTYQWTSSGSTLAAERWSSADGTRTADIAFGTTNQTQTTRGGGARTVTTTAPDRSYITSEYQNGRLTSVTRKDALDNQLSRINYTYDPHGRLSTSADARTGTTTYYFNDADQVSSTVTPSPDGVQPGQVTTNYFDSMGRIWKTRLPDNTCVTNEFFLTGLLKKKYGSREYPVEYTYDPQGRMQTLKTWQNFAGNSGSAVTTWNYNQYRGWLDSKRYPDNTGPDYTYYANGRPKERTWARSSPRLKATYTYNYAGDLANIVYSDGSPGIDYAYDRLGRLITATQGNVTTTWAHDAAGNRLSESYTGGPLAGITITNGYDHLLRRTNLYAQYSTTPLLRHSLAYDNASRLYAVTDDTGATPHAATYSYLDNSALISQIDFATGGATIMSTTKQYDYLDRLTRIASLDSQQSIVASFGYQLNTANQRTAITNADNSRWVYTYDSLGQVISGRKYWSDGTPVAGQQFDYAFDDIGNRRTAASGGDQWGANLRYQNYSVNNLNQYTNRTVPGYLNVLGTAASNATVTLWTADGSWAPTTRKADYFRGEIALNNSTGALWLTITNLAVLNDGANPDIVTNSVGSVFVSQTPETLRYDADGNMTNDGRWAFTWDPENRLATIESLTTAPTASKRRLEFTYDHLGRRIQTVTSTNSGSAYYPLSTNRFAYDGWNLIAILDSQSSLRQSFVWGLDLSGTTERAGGVGGLLIVNDQSTLNNQPSSHFVAYDGSGNVAALVNAADSTLPANYEYGPFGEPLRVTGPIGKANHCRFSTKYHEDETLLLYYGERFYAPGLGKWPSRDPLDQQPQPYLFVRNSPPGTYDVRGLYNSDVHFDQTAAWAVDLGMPDPAAFWIGWWDNMVDTDFTTMPPFTERNWQWHFNRSTTGDSRLLLLSVEILFADLACNWVTYKQDDSYEAVKHLGRALHALQDWYAHGDFNRNRTGEMPTIEGVSWNREIEWYWHNFPHQGPVDDAGMDSEGTEGRATMNVMSKSHKFSNGNVAFRANFHPGPIRITRTGRATRRYLSNFMQFVFDNSKPCGACQSTFLQTR